MTPDDLFTPEVQAKISASVRRLFEESRVRATVTRAPWYWRVWRRLTRKQPRIVTARDWLLWNLERARKEQSSRMAMSRDNER